VAGKTGTMAVAAAAQVALLVVLSLVIGLGPAGWLTGIAFTVIGWAALAVALRQFGMARFGPADLVTLTRAVLVGGVTALVVDAVERADFLPPLIVLASVALAMDAIDGWVARRTGTASTFGARFDMEIDAFLILVLSAYVATRFGVWVLAIGVLRYAFVAAMRVLPWLRAPLAPRMSSKAVAAAQGIVLTVVAAGLLPALPSAILTGFALAALVWSFTHDIVWLYRHRAVAPVAVAGPAERAVEVPRGRKVVGQVATVLAALLVLFALVAPNQLSHLTLGAFTRVPVEGLLLVALLLVLPRGTRRVTSVLVGVGLGVVTIMKLADMGSYEVFDRPFHPVFDWSFLAPGVDFIATTVGDVGAVLAVIGAILLVIAVLVLTTLSVLRLTRLAVERRTTSTRAVAMLGVVWITCAVLGVQVAPGAPVAANTAANDVYQEVRQVGVDLQDPYEFAKESANDAFRYTPGRDLLTGLRGKDVVVSFIESYGRIAVEGATIAPEVDAVLDAGTDRLRAAGFDSRSAFLTSSTFGGGSWMAHATLQSGLWIDNQRRYTTLVGSDRLTFTGAFNRAGWRTVSFAPSITKDWPEGDYFGYDRIYNLHDVGYRGPNFAYAKMPDQYTMSAFERLERARSATPVMAEIDLVSSHTPWTHLPHLIDWTDVGDGSVYRPMPEQGKTQAQVWTDPASVQAAFGESIRYSLETLISYVETYGDENLVLVFLGDHQPAPIVSGEGADHDVPITIVAAPDVLAQISGWGWQDGLNPSPDAPVWRMDTFRDRFLTSFGPRSSDAAPR